MGINDIKYYMQRVDTDGYNVLDLEEYFVGLRYYKAVGIYDIGKAKNVYTEKYADSDRLRYYLPKDYANEATVITMTFLIIGDAERRLETVSQFDEYIRVGVHRFWDTARNREFDFIVTDEIKVSDEKWHGSDPYVELTLNLQNLNGKTRLHTN